MNETDLTQLQLLQQNLQNVLLQKQQFQRQLGEIDSALKELEDSPAAYQIIGNIMVARGKEELGKELGQKKELLDLRMRNLVRQEQTLKQKMEETQEKVLKEMKKK